MSHDHIENYIIEPFLLHIKLSKAIKNFFALIIISTISIELISYSQIINSSKEFQWQWAIKEELNFNVINATWSFIKLFINCKLITCKWIFKIKLKNLEVVDRFKTHLVAHEFNQILGLDHNKTFSAIV